MGAKSHCGAGRLCFPVAAGLGCLLTLVACTEAPEPDGLAESERDRLNRGIVELAQQLQDTELELEQARRELAQARVRIEGLEAGDGIESGEEVQSGEETLPE